VVSGGTNVGREQSLFMLAYFELGKPRGPMHDVSIFSLRISYLPIAKRGTNSIGASLAIY
jgi:hypothetical protein